MQNRSLVLILTFLFIAVKSQFVVNDFTWLEQDIKGVKQITISNNGKVGIIQQFDKNGNPIFIKNNEFNGNEVFAVWYFHYDKQNRNDRTVFGHSNVGFEIESSEIKNDIKNTYTYLTKDTEEFIKSVNEDSKVAESNTNDFTEFSYLDEIKKIADTTDLLNSKSYLDLLSRKNYLNNKTKFNKQNQELASTSYNYLGEIEDVTTWRYEKNKITISYTSNTFGVKNLIVKKMDNDNNIISEMNDDKLTTFKYQNNKLIEKSIFEKDKLTSKTSYAYLNNNLTEESFEDYENNIKSIDRFEYNERGKLKTKLLDRNDGIEQYNYEYIYW